MKKVFIGFIIGLGSLKVVGSIISLFIGPYIKEAFAETLSEILGPEYFESLSTAITVSDVISTLTSIAITSLFVILAVKNIVDNDKHTGIGVCLLIFSTIVGGILYFIYFGNLDKEQKNQVETNTEVKYCSNCGFKLPSDAVFCPNCCNRVKEEEKTEE